METNDKVQLIYFAACAIITITLGIVMMCQKDKSTFVNGVIFTFCGITVFPAVLLISVGLCFGAIFLVAYTPEKIFDLLHKPNQRNV